MRFLLGAQHYIWHIVSIQGIVTIIIIINVIQVQFLIKQVYIFLMAKGFDSSRQGPKSALMLRLQCSNQLLLSDPQRLQCLCIWRFTWWKDNGVGSIQRQIAWQLRRKMTQIPEPLTFLKTIETSGIPKIMKPVLRFLVVCRQPQTQNIWARLFYGNRNHLAQSLLFTDQSTKSQRQGEILTRPTDYQNCKAANSTTKD